MLAEVTGRDAIDDPLIQAALEQMRQDASTSGGGAGAAKDAPGSKKRKDDSEDKPK
jgi:hypothetical protein